MTAAGRRTRCSGTRSSARGPSFSGAGTSSSPTSARTRSSRGTCASVSTGSVPVLHSVLFLCDWGLLQLSESENEDERRGQGEQAESRPTVLSCPHLRGIVKVTCSIVVQRKAKQSMYEPVEPSSCSSPAPFSNSPPSRLSSRSTIGLLTCRTSRCAPRKCRRYGPRRGSACRSCRERRKKRKARQLEFGSHTLASASVESRS